ncbi:hypothetical protein QJQ45_028936 [Haematococcus lacustris]|nr:hypothetical protein QJQ45_028936 [Haematococcus lacustris]
MQFPAGVISMLPHSNVYVKGLPSGCTEATLLALFSAHGAVISVRVFQQPNKAPFAFVKFNSVAEATQAILALNGASLLGSVLEVRFADSDVGLHPERVAPPSDNVFIRGFAPGSTENDLRMLFSPYGLVISARILHHGEQSGQGAAGLVRMSLVEEASRAVLALNGQRLPGCVSILVARFADSLEVKARKQAKQPMGPVQVLLQATAGFSFNPAMPMAYSSAPIYPQPNAMLVQQPRDSVPRSMMTPMPPLGMGLGEDNLMYHNLWMHNVHVLLQGPQEVLRTPCHSCPTSACHLMQTTLAVTAALLPTPHHLRRLPAYSPAATMYLAQSLPQHTSIGHLQLDTPAGSMGATGGGLMSGAMFNSSGTLADPSHPPPAPSNTTLFVSNMPANAGKLFLYETFASFGAIQSVQARSKQTAVLDDSSSTDGGKKCGFVNFVHADSAARAMAVLHQQPPSTSGQLISLEMQPKHKQ